MLTAAYFTLMSCLPKPRKLLLLLLLISFSAAAQQEVKLRKKDRRRDVALETTSGTILLRLHAEAPLHRDNFLRLVKSGFYDSVLFHRVIQNFMIQAGDPGSKRAQPAQRLGGGGPAYTLPAEIKPDLYHHKGALAAARTGDDVNPQRRSGSSQFYIVQGKTWTDAQLDSLEAGRVKRAFTPEQRTVYKTKGGTPQLDNQYTVFGFVVQGQEVVDRIAATAVNRQLGDRPVQDLRILKARLVKKR